MFKISLSPLNKLLNNNNLKVIQLVQIPIFNYIRILLILINTKITIMKREKLRSVLKTVLTFCAVFFYVNLYSQNIISRDPLDYPDGNVPGICGTDPEDPDCIITLPLAYPDQDYSFQIPLVNEGDRLNLTIDFTLECSCSSGDINFSDDGTITMNNGDFCESSCLEPYIEFTVETTHNINSNVDQQKYRLPIYRNPVKVVLVLDVSQSMGLRVDGGAETRWNVLLNSVNQFTAEFEKNYQEGDSISLIYFAEDTIMPGNPIDSNFIAITPEGFTPTNLKSSEIINADMQNQTLQDSAAMGKALLIAKEKLKDTDATKVVILFSDGNQSADPMIHEYLGNKLYNGEFLNDGPCVANDSIKYYTVRMGTSASMPAVLKNIAIASSAKYLYTTTGNYIDFEYFFDNSFYDLIKGTREPIESRINDLSPFDDSLNVPVSNNLNVYFNEPVFVNSGYLTIKRSSDDSEFESISVNSGNVSGNGSNLIIIDPDNEFESNTEYYILIDATAFKNSNDINVTGILDKTYWNFTTEDILSPDVVISSEESDPTSTSPIEILIEFSEEINGFEISEIIVTNGSAENLATSDSITFTSDITPVSDGLVSVNINSGVATDNAGNMNTAADEFTIAYSDPTNIEILKKAGISIYASKGYVIVEFLKPNSVNFTSGNIEIYSLNGSLIKKERLESNSRFKTHINDQRGIYLVKLTLDNKAYYAKIHN